MTASERRINELFRAGFTLVSVGDIIGQMTGYQESIKLLEEKGIEKTDPILIELRMRVLDKIADFLEQGQKILKTETAILSKDFKDMVLKVTELADKARIARDVGNAGEASDYIDKASDEAQKSLRKIKKPVMVLLESKEKEIRRLLKGKWKKSKRR